MDKSKIIAELKRQIVEEDKYPTDVEIFGHQIEVEEEKGGGEGEDHHIVFKITELPDGNSKESMFVYVDGFYTSYDGTDWSDCDPHEVLPYEKTVRAWKGLEEIV